MKSAGKLAIFAFVLFFALNLQKIQRTNSFFMDTASVTGNTMTAGHWVPELSMSYIPNSADGDNGFFKTAPCVTLSAKIGGEDASLSDVDIYYKFSNSSDPDDNDHPYTGACIPIPDGNPTQFHAIALNHQNHDWESNIVSGQFKVDTQCPVVKIDEPNADEDVKGDVEVKGTVMDANPDHFWLVVENSSGTKVAGPGTVNETNSFTNEKLMTWDTTTVLDGEYKIKLEARDAAGNKCPDKKPVLSDPNEDDDSVDWIDVRVENTPTVHVGDVVINEVMWMGSTDSSSDEWIELRNTTGHNIDIKNWDIIGAVSGGGGHLEIAGGSTDVIPAHGYFLISNKRKSDSAIDVDIDLVATNISLANSYDDNGKLVLKDKLGNTIDSTPNPSGSSWPKGYLENASGLHQSMERNDTPGDGISASDWHTCMSDGCNDTTFWDSEGNNYGTPGAANLSKNDPTEKEETIEALPLGAKSFSDDGLESENISKKIPIKVVGALEVTEGLKYKIKLKIKRVDLCGDFSDKQIEIDLRELGLIEKTGEIKIRVKDLNLPHGVKIVSQKGKDLVLLITIEKKKNKSEKKSKKKGQTELKPEEQVALPESGDEGANGGGDPNNPAI